MGENMLPQIVGAGGAPSTVSFPIAIPEFGDRVSTTDSVALQKVCIGI